MLLSKNAEVKLADQDGWTALHEAADLGYLEIVISLLNAVENQGAKSISMKKY